MLQRRRSVDFQKCELSRRTPRIFLHTEAQSHEAICATRTHRTSIKFYAHFYKVPNALYEEIRYAKTISLSILSTSSRIVIHARRSVASVCSRQNAPTVYNISIGQSLALENKIGWPASFSALTTYIIVVRRVRTKSDKNKSEPLLLRTNRLLFFASIIAPMRTAGLLHVSESLRISIICYYELL